MTRANFERRSDGSRSQTARFSDRLLMYGNGMPGVDGQRGKDREDALDEVRRERRLRGLGDLPPALDPDPRPGQPWLEVAGEQLGVARREDRISLGDEVQLRRGIQAVDREQARRRELLAAQGRDADLVELVEVAREDRRVLDAFEQRRVGLLGEREDALVEVQRRELAVDVPRLRQARIEFVLNGSCGSGHRALKHRRRMITPDQSAPRFGCGRRLIVQPCDR